MRAVEFKDIDYIMAVKRERSFSRAAEKEFISQPALSRIIKKVENELGATIFDRSSFPLRVTPEGEEIIHYFSRMLDIQRELEDYCEKLHREEKSEITIGAPSYFCSYVLPAMIEQFGSDVPDCRFRIIETNDSELREFLRTGFVDLGITVNADMPSDLPSFELAREMIVLTVPESFSINEKLRGARLTVEDMRNGKYKETDCPTVGMEKFRNEKFLFLKKGNDMYDRGMKICRDAGFVPDVVMYLDQLLSAFYLASAGQGVTFTRASIPHYVGGTEKVFFYKIDHPDICRSIRVYVNRPVQAGEPLGLFTGFMQEGHLLL